MREHVGDKNKGIGRGGNELGSSGKARSQHWPVPSNAPGPCLLAPCPCHEATDREMCPLTPADATAGRVFLSLFFFSQADITDTSDFTLKSS